MKFPLIFLAAVCISTVAYSAEPIARIESADLRPLPPEVKAAITESLSFSAFKMLQCKVVGKPVSVAVDSITKTWFATTAAGCGWGAAMGPIWLVRETADGQTFPVLSSGGYAVAMSKHAHNGMSDLNIVAGTASESESKRYIFKGNAYKETKAVP